MSRITTTLVALLALVSNAVFSGDRPTSIEEFYKPGGTTRVIAHRGFSSRAPENTLAAIREAIALGADMVEIDVTLSSDGKIVVIHDETLDRTTNGTGPVSLHNLEDLKKLDAGSWFAPRFAGEPIPTLEDVLTTVNGKILLNIEIKSEAVERGIAAKVIAMVRLSEMRDQVVISSFSPAALEQVHTEAPDFVTAVLYNSKVHDGLDAVEIVRDLGASVFNIKRQRLTPTILERCLMHGIPVGIYTVNKKRHMRRMIGKGVGAIFTDHPDRLIEVLQKTAPPAPMIEPATASP
jgi:glycerophosphoryl diester phosphodiesterase